MTNEQLSEQLDQFSTMVKEQFGKLEDSDVAAIREALRNRLEKRYGASLSISEEEAEHLSSADRWQERHQPS